MTTIDGIDFRLTKHGRARFIERKMGGIVVPDSVIVRACVNDPQAIWKRDRAYPSDFRLVTFLPERFADVKVRRRCDMVKVGGNQATNSRQAPAKPVAPDVPTVDVAGVAARVKARSDAQTVIVLASEMASALSGPALLAFWVEISKASREFIDASEKSLTDKDRSDLAFGKLDEGPAEKRRVVPTRQPEQSVADAMQAISDALDELEDVPWEGAEFAASVEAKLESIRETIEGSGRVTQGQQAAIENMAAGIAKWKR